MSVGFHKTKHTPFPSANSLSSTYLFPQMKACVHKKMCTRMFTASIYSKYLQTENIPGVHQQKNTKQALNLYNVILLIN